MKVCKIKHVGSRPVNELVQQKEGLFFFIVFFFYIKLLVNKNKILILMEMCVYACVLLK